jgi:hypothetical protein
MESQELLSLNAEGFIPGPNEAQESFLERVRATREFFAKQETVLPSHHWHWPAEQLKTLFDFSPRWCAASYSSKGLAPWQAAATWIDVKRIYLIQLRPSLWVSWMVDRNEILAHEAAHAARAAFDESKFEEFFAYLTSSSKWRRVIGPLFRKPVETTLLVGLLAAGTMTQMLEIFLELSLFSPIWLFSAFGICFAWSLRLMRARMQIERAAKRILPFLRDRGMVRPVLFRMTDGEIERLAKNLPFQPGLDLRWQLIKAAYWKEKHDTAD